MYYKIRLINECTSMAKNTLENILNVDPKGYFK